MAGKGKSMEKMLKSFHKQVGELGAAHTKELRTKTMLAGAAGGTAGAGIGYAGGYHSGKKKGVEKKAMVIEKVAEGGRLDSMGGGNGGGKYHPRNRISSMKSPTNGAARTTSRGSKTITISGKSIAKKMPKVLSAAALLGTGYYLGKRNGKKAKSIEKTAALGSGIKQLKSSLGSLNQYQRADARKFLASKKTTLNITKMKKGGVAY